jgi:DNA repair exonuclease SbcCD ATPase subunit
MNFKEEVKKAKEKAIAELAKKDMLVNSLEKTKQSLSNQEQYLLDAEKARVVIQTTASEIQKNLEYRISNLVTMALAAVFSDPYEFKVEFVERRNQTEADFLFVKRGNECDPLDSSGFGAVDIASIALRMAIWSIKKTRAIMILDEPSRDLSRDMQSKCSELLKLLSVELGIQMIITSHIPELIECADRVINVENIEGYSKVTVL